jgi:hypothetical protein
MSEASLKSHIKHLEEKHYALDKAIRDEYNHYALDEVIKKHKIEKLKLKTEIEMAKAKVS